MRDLKNGKFYYIDKNDIVDECFIDCLSNLFTVIGKDIKINVNLKGDNTFESTFGKYWSDLGSN